MPVPSGDEPSVAFSLPIAEPQGHPSTHAANNQQVKPLAFDGESLDDWNTKAASPETERRLRGSDRCPYNPRHLRAMQPDEIHASEPAPGDELAEPTWFRAPNRRERLI